MERLEIYRQIAHLHIRCINQGFLPQLGPRFLALMYAAIDQTDGAILIADIESDHVVGFVSGAMSMRSIYKQMLRHPFRLAWSMLPSLFRASRIRKILEVLRYGSHETDDLPKGELLSIIVDDNYRGQKRADRLYADLCRFFISIGESNFKIVVGSTLIPALRFYSRMGARVAKEIHVHKGDIPSFVLIQDLAPARGK